MVETKNIKKDEPCIDCAPPPIDTAQQPAPVVQKEISVQEAIDSINRELTALKGILEQLKNPQPGMPPEEQPLPPEAPPEAPTDSPIPPPEESKYPLPKAQDESISLAEYTAFATEYLAANPGKTPIDVELAWKDSKAKKPCDPNAPVPPEAPSNYPYPSKKDFDELKNSFDGLVTKMTQNKKLEDMEVVVKSKDDELKALMKRIEVIEKSEVTPKTTMEVNPPVIKLEKSSDIMIEERDGSFTKPFEGTMGVRDSKDLPVIKDLINRGVLYQDPDYQ
jgi:hypothetical protein